MNLLNTILQAQGGGMVKQLAQNFNLGEQDTTSALSQLMPALAQGMNKNIQSPDGLNNLMGALDKGNHARFLDNTEELTNEQTVQEGNGILGHLFGSKEVSREVANRASQKSGVDAGILKKMLPVAAAMMMGSVAKQRGGGTLSALASGAVAAGGAGLLGKFLDSDNDGSVVDDLLGFMSKAG